MHENVRASRERISRRRALALGGSVGLGTLLAACTGAGSTTTAGGGSLRAAGSSAAGGTSGDGIIALLDRANTCSLAVEQTQGPYWFDVDSIRRDIREYRPGTTLELALRVHDVSGCGSGGEVVPVADSVVEIWHCDAGGVYSGFESGSQASGGLRGGGAPPGSAPGGPGSSGETSHGSYSQGDVEADPTDDGTYLRGAQIADASGIARFTTIYPGWYSGRTVHIHVKVHVDRKTVLTTQLYMDESVNRAVLSRSPYDEHTGRDTFNTDDGIFDDSGLLTIRRTHRGYLGVINLGTDV